MCLSLFAVMSWIRTVLRKKLPLTVLVPQIKRLMVNERCVLDLRIVELKCGNSYAKPCCNDFAMFNACALGLI